MILFLRMLVASLLLALASSSAFGAANIPSDSDISEAMNPFSPEIQKILNEKAPGAPNKPSASATDTPGYAEASSRCQQLLADIDRVRYREPEPQQNTYPPERDRDGRYIAPARPVFNGSVNFNSFNNLRGGIRYDDRATLEYEFERDCR